VSIGFEIDDLVRRAQFGDKAAFNSLVVLYRLRLTRLIIRYTRNYWDAEDIVQDTFVRAYRGISGFRQESSFFTWLCQIAINLARNKHRLTMALQASFPELVNQHDPDREYVSKSYADSPEEILIGKQLAQAVISLVEQLPERLQTAYFLREIDGLSYQEIADKMACPIGTVRSRIARTRSAIYTFLVGPAADLNAFPGIYEDDAEGVLPQDS